MNHYDALGVSADCDAAELRRAFLAAARRYHPDFHVDAPEPVRATNAKRMQELNQAWAVLGDPVARSAYDRDLHRSVDPGVARRAAREPGAPPPGKGWTPRASDDGWMTDFAGWADERDELLGPDEPRSAARNALTVAPVGLFATSVLLVVFGAIFEARGLLAVAAICFILSVGLFIFLPIIEMARGRR